MNKYWIVIPVHNEARRLPAAVEQLITWREMSSADFAVMFVENASIDGTLEYLKYCCGLYDWMKYCTRSQRSKGMALRAGIQAIPEETQYIYLADVDFSTPLTELDYFFECIQHADIVIGSREINRAQVVSSWRRHVIGRLFHAIVTSLVPGIQDTQCGFKMFKYSAARKLFDDLHSNSMAYDVEILYRARLSGLTIIEMAVRWKEDSDSRVRLGSDSMAMLQDVLRLRLRGSAV